MDINEEVLDVVFRLALRYAEDLGADLNFEHTLSREECLKDADFVINTATITHNEYFMQRRREMTAEHGYFYDRTGMLEYHNLLLMLDVEALSKCLGSARGKPGFRRNNLDDKGNRH